MEICQTAGLAKGSFYVHYKSKEDIVRESYYADMGEYIQRRYNIFVETNSTATYDERIIYFMNFTQLIFRLQSLVHITLMYI